MTPLLLALLPLIPGLVGDLLKLAGAVRDALPTGEEKSRLDELEARLAEALRRVSEAPLPPRSV